MVFFGYLVSHLRYKDIIGLLWEHWLLRGKKLIEDSDSVTHDDGLGKRSQFLAAVHDIGKATPAFQAQRDWQTPDDHYSTIREMSSQDLLNSSLQLSSPKRVNTACRSTFAI